MDQAIQVLYFIMAKVVQSRINYMRQKEEKTVKKVVNVKRKLTSLENVRHKAREEKSIEEEVLSILMF